MDVGVTPRRHNPVDSICRKLQTIQRRDQDANSPFQIPKLQTNNYDSPHTGLRRNLEVILKKRCVWPDGKADNEGSTLLLTPTSNPAAHLTSRFTANMSMPITPVNANSTYTINNRLETLGEKGSVAPGYSRSWQQCCSTPAVQGGEAYFNFNSHYPSSTQIQSEKKGTVPSARGQFPYNLNFSSSDISNIAESTFFLSESKKDNMAEVSLICEEDLLDTIFQACDTQCRGKVYVSHIVDFLRHTTSRTSEDSGLEELCNMLDPEHKDISIDLDTYHAIMKEWIEDCRNQRKNGKEDVTQEVVKLPDNITARRSILLNMTSGSLEAFGEETSRADFETSDLVFCVADLQFNNQKLQEEVRKLKQVIEAMEDSNHKLTEENEELKSQAKVREQLLQKEWMLKEEVEEMKLGLSSSEESRARASAQSKQMERENQALILKISSQQEENIKMSLEMDELQKKMKKLDDLNMDLQAQVRSFDAVIAEKDTAMHDKSRQIDELKAAVMEYSSVTELLRAEKRKLESQMQMMQPDIDLRHLCVFLYVMAYSSALSLAYRLNQTSSGSLEAELALAQHNPLEGADHLYSSICVASTLDETLDRKALLFLQETPEQMSVEIKTLISRLRWELEEDTTAVLTSFRGLKKSLEAQDNSSDLKIQGLQVHLEQKRSEWTYSLEQLNQYTDSLEKELLKMASNVCHTRTETRQMSVRVQEQENQIQQLREELDQLKTPQDSREASSQTPDNARQVVEDLDGSSLDWEEDCAVEEKIVLGLNKVENCPRAPDPKDQEAKGLSETQNVEEGDCGKVEKQLLNRERETARDSVVEAEELGGSTLSQKSLPEPESCENLLSGEKDLQEHGGPQQEEARLPECTGPEDTHVQAVCCDASESASLSHSHTQCANEPNLNLEETLPNPLLQDPSPSTDLTSPPASEFDSPTIDRPGVDEPVPLPERSPQRSESEGRGPEGEQRVVMSNSQKLTQEQLGDVPSVVDRSCLLPVAEEEESMPESGQQLNRADMAKTGSEEAVTAPSSDSATAAGPSKVGNESIQAKEHTSDSARGSPPPTGSKKDSLALRSRFKRDLEMSRSMEAIEEQKAQEDGEVSTNTEKEGDRSVSSEDASDSNKEDRNSLSQSDKEIEAEFHRLSLGYKCDMFTLEKRLHLEERSRDLAEENVRREVSSCQGLLQALLPLCEDDNQSMEIIQRLQKNLDILIQSMIRVSSRSEMLGAIHQESRMGKAVEVMIQHVENLRRTYTKEHAELVELRETLMQNERSFGSHTERDDFRNKKPTPPYYKNPRRVSIAGFPRGGQMHFDMTKDGMETEAERLSRRSPWNVVGKNAQRPPLKRFISSGGWAETDGPALINRFGNETDSHSEEEHREEPTERKSSLTELGIKITSIIMPAKTSNNPSPTTEQATPCLVETHPAVASRSPWVWVAMLVVLAVLLALLASLVAQPAVDAAPVGTGDSWMTIQQLLWPYTGLRHNGQPPV
ncbi:inositol 1,4,5-triphosphate receptor associated 2 isoform X2 [Hoplias malabaricus]|uniref:inositol 1,4,5-triphosphate receptor associated 2 isoform X2 n=1 Tax=Hoplias malabaricus TaxID=27720 RepID=UPI003461DD71